VIKSPRWPQEHKTTVASSPGQGKTKRKDVDLFRLLALASAVLVPLVFLFKKGSQPTSGTAMAH